MYGSDCACGVCTGDLLEMVENYNEPDRGTARLYSFDEVGETVKERQVDFWFVLDVDDGTDAEGIYVHLEDGLGLTIKASELAKEGFIRKSEALTEDDLLDRGYVKLF